MTTPPTVSLRARVLVAEDHDINQELIMAMLSRINVEGVIAIDGAQAVAMVTQSREIDKPFDLILMDMQMPLVDGLEATRRLRSAGFTPQILPIVALTANAFALDVQACLDAGMQHHMSKPVRLDDLDNVIEKYATVTASNRIKRTSGGTLQMPVAILDQYTNRKADIFKAFSRMVERGGSTDDYRLLVQLLHKLAGTAGLFGEDALGEIASKIEHSITSAQPQDQHNLLQSGWTEMRKFA